MENFIQLPLNFRGNEIENEFVIGKQKAKIKRSGRVSVVKLRAN
jgi:hypothetical protein